MSTFPPWTVTPLGSAVAFDALTIIGGVTLLVALAGFVFLLWAVRERDRATYDLRCPDRAVRATVGVRTGRDGFVEVDRCSLFDPPTHVACARHCLQLVA